MYVCICISVREEGAFACPTVSEWIDIEQITAHTHTDPDDKRVRVRNPFFLCCQFPCVTQSSE